MIDLRESLERQGRTFAKVLLAVTVMMVISLTASGQAALIPALFIGYLVGFLYLWTLVFRTYRSAGMYADGVRRQMLFGLALRLVALFAILYVAANISVPVFASCVMGFFSVYFLALLVMIGCNFTQGKGTGI